MDTGGMDRGAIQHVSNYAFCEFDSIGRSEATGTFTPAMNQAYQWRRRIVEKKEIQQVRLIPCAVINESIDYYDEIQETKDRLSIFDPTVPLPYATLGEAQDDQIPFPIWNTIVCGGAGSGKSVIAYVLGAALLKEHGYDVVYVNYKNSDQTEALDAYPRKEAFEFAKMVEYIAGEGINLVIPEELERAVTSQDKPAAFYTECTRDTRAEYILGAIYKAHVKRPKRAKRGLFIIFDELLNQKKRTEDMAALELRINQWRTENIYLGVIHQNLSSFWDESSSEGVVNQSTIILASKLPGKDEKHYQSLSSRAKKRPLPISPVTFEEVRSYQRAQIAFLPTQETKVEHPVRMTLPGYSFLTKLETPAEDWKWGSKTMVSPS